MAEMRAANRNQANKVHLQKFLGFFCEAPSDYRESKMNKSELAQAFDVSPETVSAWLRRGCPFTKRGRNGEAYEFSLPDVVRWRVGELVVRSQAGPGATLDGTAVDLFQAF